MVKKSGLKNALNHIKNAVNMVAEISGSKSMTKIGFVSSN